MAWLYVDNKIALSFQRLHIEWGDCTLSGSVPAAQTTSSGQLEIQIQIQIQKMAIATLTRVTLVPLTGPMYSTAQYAKYRYRYKYK